MTYIDLRYKNLIPEKDTKPHIFNKNNKIVDLGDNSV